MKVRSYGIKEYDRLDGMTGHRKVNHLQTKNQWKSEEQKKFHPTTKMEFHSYGITEYDRLDGMTGYRKVNHTEDQWKSEAHDGIPLYEIQPDGCPQSRNYGI